jgi:hypothetical protein
MDVSGSLLFLEKDGYTEGASFRLVVCCQISDSFVKTWIRMAFDWQTATSTSGLSYDPPPDSPLFRWFYAV